MSHFVAFCRILSYFYFSLELLKFFNLTFYRQFLIVNDARILRRTQKIFNPSINRLMADRILDSWKEIAQYLKRDVRTCQRWEKELGLPVHRFEDSPRSRVFAYPEEIDRWLREKFGSGELAAKSKKKIRSKLIVVLIVIGVIIILIWMLASLLHHSEPYDFKLERNTLIITNQKGHHLWKYTFDNLNLSSEKEYRNHFQKRQLIIYPNNKSEWTLPWIYIGDINHDQHNEVLFLVYWDKPQPGSYLYCFNHRGKILWRYLPTDTPVFGQITYSKIFRSNGFILEDFDHDESFEIIVIFHCPSFFPTLLVLLNSEGKCLGKYWNSGRINDLLTVDLNGNGQKEIVIGFQNNEWRRIGLAVFSPDHLEGASPQTKDHYDCKNTPIRGREIYYLLLPQNELTAKQGTYNAIFKINLLDGPRLEVEEQFASLMYIFDQHMKLVFFDYSDKFFKEFKLLKEQGIFPASMTLDEIIRRIKNKGILYFDGDKWVKTATMTRFWREKLAENRLD